MLEVAMGWPLRYASWHCDAVLKNSPSSRPLLTTSPGAIPSSHAERSWGFGATVLAEENAGRFFLRGTFKEGSRYGL